VSVLSVLARLRARGLELPAPFVRDVVQACRQAAGGPASLARPEDREALAKRVAADLYEDPQTIRAVVEALAEEQEAHPDALGSFGGRVAAEDYRVLAARVAERLTDAGVPLTVRDVIDVVRAREALIGPGDPPQSPEERRRTIERIADMVGQHPSTVAWILYEFQSELWEEEDDDDDDEDDGDGDAPSESEAAARRRALAQVVADRAASVGVPATPDDVEAVMEALATVTGGIAPPTEPSERSSASWRVAAATNRPPGLVSVIFDELERTL
jgi:hypothetical protein